MLANFDTMLRFFSPEHELTDYPCEECGCLIKVDMDNKNRKRLCDSCRQERVDRVQRRKNENAKEYHSDEPTFNLALAVIRQARWDAQKGDYQAREYLEAEDGAELLLRCVGVKVDYDAERMFKEMARRGGRNRKG